MQSLLHVITYDSAGTTYKGDFQAVDTVQWKCKLGAKQWAISAEEY